MNEKDGYVVVGGEARMLCCIQGFVWKSNCSKHLGTLLASSTNKMYLPRPCQSGRRSSWKTPRYLIHISFVVCYLHIVEPSRPRSS
jgi:hypothetical protein